MVWSLIDPLAKPDERSIPTRSKPAMIELQRPKEFSQSIPHEKGDKNDRLHPISHFSLHPSKFITQARSHALRSLQILNLPLYLFRRQHLIHQQHLL